MFFRIFNNIRFKCVYSAHPVSWQDFIETTKSEHIQNYFVNVCQTISAPKHRLWTSLGVSLVVAGFSIGLKLLAEPFGTKIEPINRVENLAIDLLSQFQPPNDRDFILLKPPLRVIRVLNNPQILTAALERIDRSAKPQAFVTDSSLAQYLPTTSSVHQWQLNNRVLDRLTSIEIDSVAKLSSTQLKDTFNGKIIVIGERVTLINQSLTANRNDLNSSLNFLKVSSKAEEFIWIFGWCNLSIFAVWQMGRSFIPTTGAVVGSQIILGGVLLMMGNAVPIAMTSIAIISTGTIVFKVIATAKAIETAIEIAARNAKSAYAD